jgi:hypothetical protein
VTVITFERSAGLDPPASVAENPSPRLSSPMFWLNNAVLGLRPIAGAGAGSSGRLDKIPTMK